MHIIEIKLMLSLFSVMAFVELVQYLFTIRGVGDGVGLSNRVCQDPLEKFFGRQRQHGRANGNPSSSERFVRNTQALRIISNTCGTIRGNCRGGATIDADILDSGPLTKRPRHSMWLYMDNKCHTYALCINILKTYVYFNSEALV